VSRHSLDSDESGIFHQRRFNALRDHADSQATTLRWGEDRHETEPVGEPIDELESISSSRGAPFLSLFERRLQMNRDLMTELAHTIETSEGRDRSFTEGHHDYIEYQVIPEILQQRAYIMRRMTRNHPSQDNSDIVDDSQNLDGIDDDIVDGIDGNASNEPYDDHDESSDGEDQAQLLNQSLSDALWVARWKLNRRLGPPLVSH
jgi:hypothetical protein